MQISVNITEFIGKDHFRSYGLSPTFSDCLQVTAISSVFRSYMHLLVSVHASNQYIHCSVLLHLFKSRAHANILETDN